MALRLIEIYLPEGSDDRVEALLEEHRHGAVWEHPVRGTGRWVRVLATAEEVEPLLDELQNRFAEMEDCRILLLPVEATIPHLEESEEEAEEGDEKEAKKGGTRISRDELYTEATGMTRLTPVYALMVLLSTVVAAIGMLQDSVAVVIGAMVIAPLLGPNMALSLATTLGDLSLARTAIRSNGVGVLVALAVSVLIGFLLAVDPTVGEIASRTRIDLGDVTLALASGSAGALAFTTGVSAILVGVMVAVALLPPLVAVGLLLGSGRLALAGTAALLLLANLICVNLAGVLTFLIQGVRPRTWLEAEQARKAIRIAVSLWTILLAVLIVTILISQGALL